MGGRGPFREPTSAADWSHLEQVVKSMFPAAADAAIAYRWCGRVAADARLPAAPARAAPKAC